MTTINRRAALAAAGGLALPGLARAQGERLSLRLDFSPWGVQAAIHLAEARGWFREAGLTVDIQDGRGSGNTLQLVNAGQVDVGQIQLGLLAQAREQGATVRGFAGFSRRTDLCVLVDRDSPVQRAADLRGRSLVVFAASPWAPFIDAYLRSGGLDRSSVNVMFVDPSALWGTYTAKRADGLMSTVSSAIPVAERPRPSRALLAEDAGIFFPSYGLMATEATIRARGPALRKLVETQQRAWTHLRSNPDDGVEAMIRNRPDARLDRAVTREQIRLTLEFFDTPATRGRPIGWQAEEDWVAALRSLEAAGAIKPGWNAASYFTNEVVG
ncbi:ABC transporter substrate-binding protein [Sabulicella glaciei]|uniref:Thiamine pyrimidine synthase n=1 Tax=Sabulicella glaciei TaxID=2984948 RepID=A0ABT3NZ31_9PROT|nr:ABC transporter substrate-binding protein [Roseococcus sp. MDT2-1-1]MCW8087415.1 ABC transporter substrate-binding protein [Roseococcus sp. MDT2-1-1]